MTTTTTRPAMILAEGAELDPFAQPAATTVAGGKLRDGMVLLDPELGTPAYVIDHRIGSAGRGTGAVTYLVHNLEAGGWEQLTRHANARVIVAAR